MKLRLSAICILSLAAALSAGCVESATTANTVSILDTEGVASAVAEEEKSLFEIPTPAPTIAPIKISIRTSPSTVPSATDGLNTGTAAQLSASPAVESEPSASPVPEDTPKAEQEPEYTVKDMDDADGYVYAKSVNLRSGPGEEYEVIREYSQYRTLTVTGKSGDWYRVKVGSRSGFMLMEYVKLGEPPKSTPKPTATPKATKKPEATATPVPEIKIEATEKPSNTGGEMSSGGGYSGDELYLIAQVVYKEGDSESYTAVASVIYNRLKSSKFPSTVSGVIYQKGQFSTSSLKAPSSAAENSVTAVFVNGGSILPSDVLYFRSSGSWSHQLYAKIGGNYFYY